MATLPDYIIDILIDAEEARDFYNEADYPKMKANLLHLRDTASKALELSPKEPTETEEPSDAD